MVRAVPLAFRRVAIVNRGEPAIRLIRAARDLNEERAAGLVTIALYTEPDRRSLFVREADEAFCLGPALANGKSTYLDYARLERALVETRAEAAWVGWGFVAEQPEFAELCERLGIVFVGPPAEAMKKLGDKITAKRVAQQAEVPVAPWSGGPVATLEEAEEQAKRIGFPLVLKATAGGGGRGIRKLHRLDELAGAFESARSEAVKSFGDDTVYLEKMVLGARHVEVQVLLDTHGTAWAVGLRDCTLQRRQQKIVEEAPPSALSEAEQRAISDAAIRLAVAARYVNAGTAEFLFDPKTRAFYFMEMNTRLQVEHPVTEMTSELDLVRLQLHIASGGRLDATPPAPRGHAIEVRLCAEDPDNGFAPAPGRIELFRTPGGSGIRVDSGVTDGDVIAPEFDSMIAKIIAYGRDRSEALARIRRALTETKVVIEGGATNKAFLLEVLGHADVAANEIDIAWLDSFANERSSRAGPFADLALLSAAIDAHDRETAMEQQRLLESARRGRVSVGTEISRTIDLGYRGKAYRFEVSRCDLATYRIALGDRTWEIEAERQGRFDRTLRFRGSLHHVFSVAHGSEQVVEVGGVTHRISRDDGGFVRAVAPGLVISVHVEQGARVRAGDVLVVLEAMKMEMLVRAPQSGRIRQVLASANSQVPVGAPLVSIEPDAVDTAASPQIAVDFPDSDSTGPVDAVYVLENLRRRLLGFDVSPIDPRTIDLDAQTSELRERLVHAWADLIALYSPLVSDATEPTPSGEELLVSFLRVPETRGKNLPKAFLARLSAAIRHYGVDSLDDSARAVEAILWIEKARRRLDAHSTTVGILLERPWVERNTGRYSPGFRAALDRVIAVSAHRAPSLQDFARQIRFRYFDQPEYREAQARLYSAMRNRMLQLSRSQSRFDREIQIQELVHCPQPLLSFLSTWLADEERALGPVVLEVFLRRFYGGVRELVTIESGYSGRHAFATGELTLEGQPTRAVAVHASDLSAALATTVALTWGVDQVIVVDLLLIERDGSEAVDTAECVAALSVADLPEAVARVTVVWMSPDSDRVRNIHTFSRGPSGFSEVDLYRGIHPLMAARLELWRLTNFHTERLPSSEDVYLIRAVGKSNPKDERLFAFAYVRDLTPLRSEDGQFELPHLEHIFHQTLAAIRDYVQVNPRQALLWNRVILHIWPTVPMGQNRIGAVLRRLAHVTRSLGIEKIVAVLKERDDTGRLVPRTMHVAVEGGVVVRMRIGTPSPHPIRELTPYNQRVARLRRRKMTYPYEIVRMLTPSTTTGSALFPAGSFIEYDLDDAGVLLPVERAYGQNRANVVVGVISNITVWHPEGMQRVTIFNDPSRDMGALAEPECRRIIAAIDLAEAKDIPIEWFPVSSGAAISLDSGTENLDWTARVLRRLIEYTQRGGEVNFIVAGVNVGAQSYWNAEATMLMHTRGILVMTPDGAMVLTGKRALEYSGGVSAEDHQGIGGADKIMGPNGQAQYFARDLSEACRILFRHYELTYVAPGEHLPRRHPTSDPVDRDVTQSPYEASADHGFTTIGDVLSNAKNPGRKKPFDIRQIMRAAIDQDEKPLERWSMMRHAEMAIVWDACIGGIPACVIGIESKPVARLGFVPADGPESWMGGTLFPLSSKKVARALNSASGRRPAVILANLSGFDGSPESMRRLQLEYGAEIGRAVVNFDGPIVFCVISRYHGGAYVVFSRALNEHLEVAAVEGAYASVIGGAPAAAVVFTHEVQARTRSDARVRALAQKLASAAEDERPTLQAELDVLSQSVHKEKIGELAEEFDRIHSVERAQKVGSIDEIIAASKIRPFLVDALERGIARWLRTRFDS